MLRISGRFIKLQDGEVSGVTPLMNGERLLPALALAATMHP